MFVPIKINGNTLYDINVNKIRLCKYILFFFSEVKYSCIPFSALYFCELIAHFHEEDIKPAKVLIEVL